MDSLKFRLTLDDKIRERAHLEVVRSSGLKSTIVYPALILLLPLSAQNDSMRALFVVALVSAIAALLSGIWRFRIGKQILREEGKETRPYRLYRGSVMLTGILWSGYASFVAHTCAGSPTAYLAVLSCLCIVAGSTSTLTPDLRLLRSYTLVMIVPACLILILEGGRTEGVTGLMVVAFTLFVWSTGKVHHQRFISWLRYNQLLDLRTKQLQESRRQAAEMLEQETAQRQQLGEQNVALEKARHEADVANQSKSAFLASMSHEIRTPMNAIVTLSDLLHETALSPQQMEWVETIKQGCDSLLSLISDVLDMAKIEAGRVELSRSRFSPTELCQELVRLLQANATQKGLQLELEAPSESTLYWGDRHRLRQVLLNLLGNALKFTHHGSVKLIHAATPEYIQFTVSDSGVGLSDPEKLFKPFSQLDTSSTREFGGTGLGLAISQRLAELMGGWVWAESGELLAGNPPPFWESDGACQAGSSFHLRILTQDAPEAPLAEVEAGGTRETGRSLDILVVEDNLVNQKVLRHLLEKLGHKFSVVDDGLEALETLEKHSYEVILMDLQMPRLDGVAATQRIRAIPNLSRQPWIIAVTANAFEEDRKRCLEAGMNDFLTKPLRRDALLEALERVQLSVAAER